MGLGPSLATGGAELSLDRIQLPVNSDMKRCDENKIGPRGIGRSRPMLLIADVRWCGEDEETDTYLIGAGFWRRLAHADLGLFV